MRNIPGPWYYVTGAVWTTPNGPDDGGQCVATRARKSTILPTYKDKAMRLCAAAPELLYALHELVAEHDAINETRDPARDGLIPDSGGIAYARTIIAKVAGE